MTRTMQSLPFDNITCIIAVMRRPFDCTDSRQFRKFIAIRAPNEEMCETSSEFLEPRKIARHYTKRSLALMHKLSSWCLDSSTVSCMRSHIRLPSSIGSGQTCSIRDTAWLDGLRGLASLNVYVFHTGFNWGFRGDRHLQLQWNSNEFTRQWWRLPLFRLPYSSYTHRTC